VINITEPPPSPSLGYRIELDDGSLRYALVPVGSRWTQLVLYWLLGLTPLLTAIGATLTYLNSFYQIKFNRHGVSKKTTILSAVFGAKHDRPQRLEDGHTETGFKGRVMSRAQELFPKLSSARTATLPGSTGCRPDHQTSLATVTPTTLAANVELPLVVVDPTPSSRRTVLIATMEYDIEDWNIKIKIGGLGVMTQLMGKYLGHHNLIWVVPCVGGVDYPSPESDELPDPMDIRILGSIYRVRVQTHVLRNITYVLLDAPVFRKQTKAEPYPPRMDDIESAIYYSAWNYVSLKPLEDIGRTCIT